MEIPILPNNIQLSPEWVVNSFNDLDLMIIFLVNSFDRDAKRRRIYPPLFTDPDGDSCFSIYQTSWIKMKKVASSFFLNGQLSI